MEREHITPQGVSVFHDKNENIHSFCLCLYVRAGSLFETKENNGISHFFEHIVFKNIHYQMGENLYQTLDRCGLDFNAWDHSLVEEMVRLGEVRKEDAKDHPDKNIITRAVGVLPEVTADFFEISLKPGDEILMCSDGLTNMIEDDEIRHSVLGQRDIVEKAEKLIETANRNGGKDNITVVLIEPFSDEVKEC